MGKKFLAVKVIGGLVVGAAAGAVWSFRKFQDLVHERVVDDAAWRAEDVAPVGARDQQEEPERPDRR